MANNMTCGIKLPETTTIKQLENNIGNNHINITDMILYASNDFTKFSDSFKNWYVSTGYGKTVPNFNTTNESEAKTLAEAITNYWYYNHPSVSFFTRQDRTNNLSFKFGYANATERELGKAHSRTILLDEFLNLQKKGEEITENKYNYYLGVLRKKWANFVFQEGAKLTGKSVKELLTEFKEAKDKIAYIDNMLGGHSKSIIANNYFSVYKELVTSKATALNYIMEVAANPKVSSIFQEIKDSADDIADKLKEDESSEQNETAKDKNEGAVGDVDLDTSITLSEHSGLHTTYLTHIGTRIRNYFNTLRKLNSPIADNIDTNNTYGLAETMDANSCCSMLYNNNVSFSNVPSMIATIHRIGETVKGFEAFVQFAQDLTDDYDFATEVFSTFVKMKIFKTEVVIEDGVPTTRIANFRADPRQALVFDLQNDIKGTVFSNNEYIVLKKIADLQNIIKICNDSIKTINDVYSTKEQIEQAKIASTKTLQSIIKEITSLIKTYYPSIDAVAINSYITMANDASADLSKQLKNVESLVNDIQNTANASTKTKAANNEVEIKANNIAEHNDKLTEEALQGKWIDRNDYKDEKSVYGTDVIAAQHNSIFSIVDKILPYSVVNTDLNSRNIHGNNNSNIINTSFILQLKGLTEKFYRDSNGVLHNDQLLCWGREKLKSKQYKYSNILLEQYDENGKLLNPNGALFKYVNGELVLSNNADKALQITLFMGASNLSSGTNIDYTGMVMGDMLPTQFMAFFSTKDAIDTSNRLATYFTRTPSDAPKTFNIRGARYDTSKLFIIADENKYAAELQEAIEKENKVISTEEWVNNYRPTDYKENPNTLPFYELRENANLNYWLEPESVNIHHSVVLRKIEGTEKEDGSYDAYFTALTKNGIGIVLRGTVVNVEKGQKLTNVTREAIVNLLEKAEDVNLKVNAAEELNNIEHALQAKIQDKVYANTAKKIDVNHPVFQMFKREFKQEILDGAIAVEHYFVLEEAEDGTYYVQRTQDDSNKPVVKSQKALYQGYSFYHKDSDGKILTKTKNGYALRGGVFGSNKFTLEAVDEKGNIYKKNYMDDIFTDDTTGEDESRLNFLYGGAIKYIGTKTENGVEVTDVELSDKVDNKINELLSEFVRDYIAKVQRTVETNADFIVGVSTNFENIVEYALNSRLMLMNYDVLFEGSTKFYKDSQTILKRAKEYQGSGNPYGNADYSGDGDIYSMTESKTGYLSTGTIIEPVTKTVRDKSGKIVTKPELDENGKAKTKTVTIQELFDRWSKGSAYGNPLKGVVQRNAFTAVTVANTNRTNETALKELVNKLQKESGLSEEDAMTILYGPVKKNKKTGKYERKGGFTNTTVNDAQSYITFQEWVRRIANRGQLNRYLPLIKKLLDDKATLTAKDWKEFVQVQKNFYYDLRYDDRYGIEVPRQIKNAEFVLIPRFIKGTQLQQVYEAMQKAGVDQLNTKETSKASNEQVLTLWDNDANLTEKAINTFVKEAKVVVNSSIGKYSYNYLYTQQETPQHMNSSNKAGIQLLKKIVDNLPNDGELGELKNQFFKLFNANIKEAYDKVLNDLNIAKDENGNILFDEYGNVIGLDLNKLYGKLRDELIRTGIDSNLLDYVTLDGSNKPLMPSYMNNTITKFESIVQSLFNSNITRQKLPGFHAAQITNVGWKSFGELSEEDKKHISYDRELKYHPDGKPYIEIIIPYSILGIDRNSEYYKDKSDKEILDELEADNIINTICYRIPTEGKQSMCNAKVVGFIDDALGSTIIVPDDWVSQTGSDFDIDSVYGVNYETYIDHTGRLRKVKYIENPTKYDWINYLRKNLKKLDDSNTKSNLKNATEDFKNRNERIKAGKQNIKNILSSELAKLEEKENDIFKSLNKSLREYIIKLQSDITKDLKANNSLNTRKGYIYRLDNLTKSIQAGIDGSKNKELVKVLTELNNSLKDINNYLKKQPDAYNAKEKELIDSIINDSNDSLNAAAKEAGLMTLDEFLKADPVDINDTKARNNKLLDTMIGILSSPKTLEENLSRSNFDELVDGRNKSMDENTKNLRDARSPYDPIDQMLYQEDAMSGANLKAFSVTLDTFCSVCNVVRPTLSTPVKILYDTKDVKDIDTVKESYPDAKIVNGQLQVEHNTYGWSHNNRNVKGMILTAYTSQTTALILDAIKEGAIPNVNAYTFSVFKTIANIGCEYTTACAYMKQPGITEIIKCYNSNKSIFSTKSGNPIHQAITNIAKQLNIDFNKDTPITAILSKINKQYKAKFNELFELDGEVDISLDSEHVSQIPLIATKLDDRNKDKGVFASSPVEERLIFDLGVVLSYYNIKSIADEIGDIARCCNPDKFGAKQTVFATRKVFENIRECIFDTKKGTLNEDGTITFAKRVPILKVGNNHILESIYPGSGIYSENITSIVKNITKSTSKSSYPTLHSFLKYATGTSVLISNSILDTQNDDFVNLVSGLSSVFSGYRPEVNEDTYNDFQKYILSSLYNNVPAIAYKVQVRLKNGKITLGFESDVQNEEKREELKEKERIRIYGYGYSPDTSYEVIETLGNKKIVKKVPFTVEHIDNVSNTEMENFEKLTPAQKIQWIKSVFTDSGIFKYINVNTVNGSDRGSKVGMQTLEYSDQSVDTNVMYSMFNDAFYNKNPLIVSAAIDLVKYGMQVEGFRMGATNVNKLIDNDCLINDFGENGLGFVAHIHEQMRSIGTLASPFASDSSKEILYENYLRSHPECTGVSKIYGSRKNLNRLGFQSATFGMYVIKKDANDKDGTFNSKLSSIGIKYQMPISKRYITNKYIRITTGKDTSVLYKINDLGNTIVLYPLTNLNTNENSRWSTREKYNDGILLKEAYKKIINRYAREVNDKRFGQEYVISIYNKLIKEGEIKNGLYNKIKNKNKEARARAFNLETLAEEKSGSFQNALDAIKLHFKNPLQTERLFINCIGLTDYIFNPGIENGSPQTIHFENGARKFIISIPKDRNDYIKAFLTPDENGNFVSAKNIRSTTVRNIILTAQNSNQKNLRNLSTVFEVIEDVTEDDSAMAASVEEVYSDSINFASTVNIEETKESSVRFRDRLKNNSIELKEASILQNETLVSRELATHATITANAITNRFEHFVPNPELISTDLSITDSQVLDICMKSPEVREKYLETVNMAKAFVEQYKGFLDYNDDNKDSETRLSISKIREAYDKVVKLPVSDAMTNFCRKLAEEQSTNPTIREGLVDVMDGFWKTYGSMWQYHDIMENGNPIIQLFLKDVMSDIDAKKKAFVRLKRNHRDKIREIQERARQRGENIDINKLIDKDGDFVEDYVKDFLKDRDEFKNAVSEAISVHGLGSIEHLKAKLKYDAFKALYINQEAKQDYYLEKVRLEAELLNSIPELYSKYMKLHYRELELYTDAAKTGYTDEIRKELNNILLQIDYLVLGDTYNDNGVVKSRPVKYDNTNYTEEEELEIKLYSAESRDLLDSQLQLLNELNKEYFEYDATPNFHELLNKHLATIEHFENRIGGISTENQVYLESIPAYVEAKDWIRSHAKFEIQDKNIAENSIMGRVKKALKILKKGGNGKNHQANKLIREANGGKGIKDLKGVPDARLLTEEEIRLLKAEQAANFGFEGEETEYSDRILLSNASPIKTRFKKEFYNKMKTGKQFPNPIINHYYNLVTELNQILERYFDNSTGIIDLARIKDDAEGIETLKRIAKIYSQIREYREGKIETNENATSAAAAHIRANVDFETNTSLFLAQQEAVTGRSQEYLEAFFNVICETKPDGTIYFTEEGIPEPNQLLFGYAKPKGEPGQESYDRWIDTERTEALALINEVYEKTTTPYYDMKRAEVMKAARDANDIEIFNTWYRNNHIYNPYTRKMQPLDVWLNYDIKSSYFRDSTLEGKWVPKYDQKERHVKDGYETGTYHGEEIDIYDESKDKRNHNYKQNEGHAANYIVGAQNRKYDNPIKLNKSEKEMKKYLKDVLLETAHTDSARAYFNRGHLPLAAKKEQLSAVKAGKEALKLLGLGMSNNKQKGWFEEIGFEHHHDPQMPMLSELNNKVTAELKKKLETLEKNPPERKENESDTDFENRVKANNKAIEDLKEKIKQEQNALINRDWYDVIESYLERANEYNAILDNKQKLYFLLNAVKNLKMYSRKNGLTGDLKTKGKDTDIYDKSVDENLIKQLENWMRRLMFDQWKENEGFLNKIADNLQGFTSANYMMLNFRGGIANVTLGETGILAEAAAREQFGLKYWRKGTHAWMKGSISFARSGFGAMFGGSDVSYSKEDAIAKYFNVVDYDEKTGVIRDGNLDKYSEHLRNLMFSPQTIGEHFMQNSVLYAMLMSNKIVTLPNEEITCMTENQYIAYKETTMLINLLDDAQKEEYAKFKEDIKKDPNAAKEYAWFRRDAITEFVYLHCDKSQIEKFKKLRKDNAKQIKEEFNKEVSLYDQLELGTNGKMAFKKDSLLYNLDKEQANTLGNVTKAEALLGAFTEKVRKVNNKIHGVYNKAGAAYIERKWFGSLIMQYHKHLPMGLLKRYMARGHWNETRQGVNKGMIQSLQDLLSLNARKIKADAGFTDSEVGAIEGFQFMIGHIGSYLTQLHHTFSILPEYDKANIFRNLGDAVGVLAGMLTVAAMWYIADDDKEMQDELFFNLCLYEADRLASEAFLYNPLGMINESKKLMSTPVAAQSVVTDMMSSIKAITEWIFEDDYNPYYESGRFAGEAKLGVYIQRRIPMWNGIRGLMDTPSNNHYYKLAQNPIGLFNIKNTVTED